MALWLVGFKMFEKRHNESVYKNSLCPFENKCVILFRFAVMREAVSISLSILQGSGGIWRASWIGWNVSEPPLGHGVPDKMKALWLKWNWNPSPHVKTSRTRVFSIVFALWCCMSDFRCPQSDAFIAGLYQEDSIHPHVIVRYDVPTRELRQLLDNNVATDYRRFIALLKLANPTRLIILTRSRNDTLTTPDVTAHAMDIDIPTATKDAVMGLMNASALTGTAISISFQANSSAWWSAAPYSRPFLSLSSHVLRAFKLCFTASCSQTALDALVNSIHTDHSLQIWRTETPAILQPAQNESNTTKTWFAELKEYRISRRPFCLRHLELIKRSQKFQSNQNCLPEANSRGGGTGPKRGCKYCVSSW